MLVQVSDTTQYTRNGNGSSFLEKKKGQRPLPYFATLSNLLNVHFFLELFFLLNFQASHLPLVVPAVATTVEH